MSSHNWNTGAEVSPARPGEQFLQTHNERFHCYRWSGFQEPDTVIKSFNGSVIFFFLEHRNQDPYLPGRKRTGFEGIGITGEKHRAFHVLRRRPTMVSALWAHQGVIHRSPDILHHCRHTILIFKQLQEYSFSPMEAIFYYTPKPNLNSPKYILDIGQSVHMW